ncbi:RNA polymerase sigma factor [Leucobacter soli]|uniref:ECF RNA polymerase sigma factor SigE n=1 Tax=Leucobacter soli TaxID=2812850 RepID=A0A916NKN9_9MICO|nr:RNA polymerase sigma factor [Leucobacter soli]CAG7598606.1 ECF RNA polymerase sigma factor SigE [Leucobacter soli]
MQDTDDATLLADIVAGSEVALAEIYARHRRAVYAQGYVETASRADAEEVLQDTFFTLWRKRRGVRIVGDSALPWLLVTAKNLARNRRRYQARRAASELPDELGDDRADPAQAVVRGELASTLAEALGGLEPIDRQIVHLCLVEGASYQEAADRLRSTHATVRNRLSRARKSVRVRLEAETEEGRA